MEQQFTQEQFEQKCDCGSSEKAGTCCLADKKCPCGSGKNAGECCFAQK